MRFSECPFIFIASSPRRQGPTCCERHIAESVSEGVKLSFFAVPGAEPYRRRGTSSDRVRLHTYALPGHSLGGMSGCLPVLHVVAADGRRRATVGARLQSRFGSHLGAADTSRART